MAKCSSITRDGQRCRGIAIDGLGYCYAHDPDRAEERRRNAHKGGKRGGRGRPSVELARLQARFEELAEKVLSGDVERGVYPSAEHLPHDVHPVEGLYRAVALADNNGVLARLSAQPP